MRRRGSAAARADWDVLAWLIEDTKLDLLALQSPFGSPVGVDEEDHLA